MALRTEEQDKNSYYAVIPANVRYCPDLKPNEKLLYGEITALCNQEGYCWASNKYFTDLYGVDQATVSRWIGNLITCGFIRAEYQESNMRKLFIPGMKFWPLAPSAEDPPVSPEKPKKKETSVATPIELPTAIDTPEVRAAWEKYRAVRKEMRKKITPTAEVLAIKHLLEYSKGDPSTALEIIEKSIVGNWQGIFPLKGQANGTAKGSRGYSGFDEKKYQKLGT